MNNTRILHNESVNALVQHGFQVTVIASWETTDFFEGPEWVSLVRIDDKALAWARMNEPIIVLAYDR